MDVGDGAASVGPGLPPLPADGLDIGVLPRVIKTLVERRAVVKKMLKKEKVRHCILFLFRIFSCLVSVKNIFSVDSFYLFIDVFLYLFV